MKTCTIWKLLPLAALGGSLWLTGAVGEEKDSAPSSTIPAEWRGQVTDAAQLPVEKSAWGTLQWVCNGKLMPGAEQTVGLATILPGKSNPVHFHPNCEEVLYVLSGQGTHSCDGRTVALKAGMTIRIPPNVKHSFLNTGTEPLRTLVSFSTGDRRSVFLEASPAK
jgi:mannose-6-phosphate isomerase-like protein (cupin superfamily)